MNLLYCTTDQVLVLSILIIFVETKPLLDLEFWKYTVLHTFLLLAVIY